MILRLFLGQERAGALEHILNAQLTPGQELRVTVVEQRNTLAVDDQGRVFALFKINGAVETAMHGVILHGICQLLRRFVRSVDGDDLNIVSADRGAEYQTADTAEAIDANFNHTRFLLLDLLRTARSAFHTALFYIKSGKSATTFFPIHDAQSITSDNFSFRFSQMLVSIDELCYTDF